jgi:signal transduction histidine kinase
MIGTRRLARVVMRPTEQGGLPRPLPLGLPLLVAMLFVLRVDQTFGVTRFAVSLESGFSGGLLPGGLPTLLADVVTVLVVMIVLLGMELTGRPRTRGVAAAFLVIAALVGLQLGAAAVVATTGAAVPTDLQLARALLLATSTVAALSLLGALSEHQRATAALRSATVAAESLAMSGRVALAELRADVARRVQSVLREALAALEVGGVTGSGARLRSLADEVVRPLSHRLAAMPVTPAMGRTVVIPARWRDTLGTLLRTPVVPPWTLALLSTGLAFLRTLVTDQDAVRDLSPAIPPDAEGVGVALTVDVMPLLVVFGELALVLVVTRFTASRLARLVEQRRDTLRPLVAWILIALGAGGMAVAIVAVPALSERVAGLGDPITDIRGGIVAVTGSLVPLLVVIVGTSLAGAIAADRSALEADLARQRAEAARAAARVQAVLGHEQRRLARSLHADVQATINAAGLLLDRADREGVVMPSVFDEAAARIATSVERFLAGGASQEPIGDRLSEVRALWAGVCTIAIELDDAVAARIDEDTVIRELIVDIVTEACANAVVHGDAGEVSVRITLADEEVELDIVDDGSRREAHDIAPDGSGGLGTDMLRASCTSFALDLGERGGRLHAVLPLG